MDQHATAKVVNLQTHCSFTAPTVGTVFVTISLLSSLDRRLILTIVGAERNSSLLTVHPRAMHRSAIVDILDSAHALIVSLICLAAWPPRYFAWFLFDSVPVL